jgi:predicted secreted Zn-dependent protease
VNPDHETSLVPPLRSTHMPRALPATLLALAALTSGCLPGHARVLAASPLPGLEVSVDETFYGVAGLTALDLNRDLFRRAVRHEGARYQGLTDFRVAYSYEPAWDPSGCRTSAPRVSVRVVTTLPRWEDRDVASEGLRSDWDLYLSRLREHEQGHQRIAIVAGRELLEQVAALRAPDCDALRRTAAAVADAYQVSVDAEQKVWDDETDHGLAAEGGS